MPHAHRRGLLAAATLAALTIGCGSTSTASHAGTDNIAPADVTATLPAQDDAVTADEYPGVPLDTTAVEPAIENDSVDNTVAATTQPPPTDPSEPPLLEILTNFDSLSCTPIDPEELRQLLDDVLSPLEDGTRIEVHGWVDSRGDADAMAALAQCRADHVAEVIAERHSSLRVVVVPHGIADLRDRDCQGDCPQNRAVTIELAT